MFLAALLMSALHGPALSGNEMLRFTILHTNDEHSHLLPHPLADYQPGTRYKATGGIAHIAAKADRIRREKKKQNVEVIMVSAGDFMGGAPYGWLDTESIAPELQLMQQIGYHVITPGNHEFDCGPDFLAAYLERAGYPGSADRTAIVASNMHPPPDHPLSERGLQPHHLRQLENGLTLGFLGLLGRGAQAVSPFTDPLRFSDPVATAARTADTLRALGADVIIAITHSGLREDIELAEKVPEIDLIIGGHSHDALSRPLIANGTPIVHAGYHLRYLGQLDLAYDPSSARLTVLNEQTGTPFLHRMDHSVEPDPEIARTVAAWTDTLNRNLAKWTDGKLTDFYETIAWSDFHLEPSAELQEHQLGNVVADAMRLETTRILGKRIDVAIQANGSLRAAIPHGKRQNGNGPVLFYDAVSAVGLGCGQDGRPGYPLLLVYLTGEELRRVMEISILTSELLGHSYYLQFSGLRMRYDRRRAVIFRIPFTGTPVPGYRTVSKAWRYTGDGIQEEYRSEPVENMGSRRKTSESSGGTATSHDAWVPLDRHDQQLYSVVIDQYVASFLPKVSALVPRLTVIPKDKHGNPVRLDEAVIMPENNRELKLWETVTWYLRSFQDDNDGTSIIPDVYRKTGERLIAHPLPPIWRIPLLLFFIVVSAIGFGLWRWWKR